MALLEERSLATQWFRYLQRFVVLQSPERAIDFRRSIHDLNKIYPGMSYSKNKKTFIYTDEFMLDLQAEGHTKEQLCQLLRECGYIHNICIYVIDRNISQMFEAVLIIIYNMTYRSYQDVTSDFKYFHQLVDENICDTMLDTPDTKKHIYEYEKSVFKFLRNKRRFELQQMAIENMTTQFTRNTVSQCDLDSASLVNQVCTQYLPDCNFRDVFTMDVDAPPRLPHYSTPSEEYFHLIA